MTTGEFLSSLNIAAQCREYKVSVWACPTFLFIIMGLVNISGMVGTAIVAQRFSDDPEVIIVSVSLMAAFLFIVGNGVVSSFQRLADASRIKSEFINIVSHQLRSPLSAIKWQLEIMLEQIKTLSGEAQGTINTIRDQNERMIALVNDLLEVNRIDDDRLILRPTLLALDQVVETIIKEYIPLMESNGLRYIFDAKERPLWVFVDESKLRWVTENLLDNAIRYTKSGGEVAIHIVKDKNEGRVEVADTGVGIPFADQGRIFTKFFRADNVLRIRVEGTGLGLYLVKSLVKAMGGKVGFASLEDKGSTFWYALPLVKKEDVSPKK